MGRPRTVDDETILTVARRLFRNGGHTVSTRMVAREVGVSQAVLFQRFPSKAELFFAAMAPEPPDVAAILGRPEAVTDVRRYLENVATKVLAYFAEALPIIVQLMAHPEFDARVVGKLHGRILLEPLSERLADQLAAFDERGLLRATNPRAVADTFVAALHSFVMFHAMSGADLRRPSRHIGPPVVDVLWQGLRP